MLDFKKISVSLIFICWFSYLIYNYDKWTQKLFICILTASIFACIESTYRKIFINSCKTTVVQFISNMIYAPIMIEFYNYLFPDLIINTIFFPFNCWVYEIVLGYYLIYLYGENVAWGYDPTSSFVFFQNNVDLRFYPCWICLCLFKEWMLRQVLVGYIN